MASSRSSLCHGGSLFVTFSGKVLVRVLLAVAVMAMAMASPRAAWAEGFVPDVPDSPLSIETIEVSAFGGSDSAAPGESLEIAQLVPMRLQVHCNPASASFGIDCGMPEMCGIDPCLCGSADTWGACSCNGYEECYPDIECVVDDPSIVAVDTRDDGIFLRAAGNGTSTVKVRASMAHHDDAVAEFVVHAGGMRAADFALVGIVVLVIAIVAAAVVGIVAFVRLRSKHAIPPMATLLVLCLCAGIGLCGCGSASVSGTSPHLADVTLKPTSDMTEASQKAEIRITFDQPVSVSNNVLDDFELLMNGSPLDDSTVVAEALPNATGVTIVLKPAEGAMGVGKGSYFALYQADLDLRAKRSDGGLPSVTGADGSAAVLDEPIKGTFPSGMAIEELEVIPGSEATGQVAQTIFKVDSPATIRAVTWFSPDGGETKLLKHNHMFMDASAEDCAADLAKVINAASGLGISASAQGDTVVMRASAAADGQELHPVLVEGIGAEGGLFEALAE